MAGMKIQVDSHLHMSNSSSLAALTMVNDLGRFAVMSKRKQSQMEEVSISQSKATCLALLARVKRTKKPILVLRKGEPIAQVIPPPPPSMPQSWLGSFSSSGHIVGDIIHPVAEPEDWEALRS
jgi:antitoxin (DNA-binding transcriptional repressor) of toxin-antitoxin stability system